MDLPTLISRTCPFPILGVLGGFFLKNPNSNVTLKANIEDPDQTSHYAMADLDLHCLPMSHKKDARLKWVKCFLKLDTSTG